MKKGLAWALVLIVAISLFAECGLGAAPKLIKVKTSGQNVVQTSVPLVAGEQMKTWKKLGLNVSRIHYVSGPPQLEANPSGDWDIGWIGATACITGMLKYDMVLIGLSGYDYSNMAFARESSDIVVAGAHGVPGTMGTAKQWKGKNIICGVGTVNYCDLMLTLKALGLSDEDVNIINMDISTGMQAFLSGQGDVYYASSTYATNIARRKGYKVVHTMKGMEAGMAGCLIANRKYLAANEGTAVKYLTGALQVIFWLGNPKNADQAAEWFIKVMKEDFGIKMTKQDALNNIKQIGFRNLEFYEDLCKVGNDGLTGMQREFKKFFEYHVIIGSQEAKNLDKVMNSIDTKYLKKALELYKKSKH
jgi:ABC-type nitrate/sulfonate/bicarbonate transport system substrate-binding protein